MLGSSMRGGSRGNRGRGLLENLGGSGRFAGRLEPLEDLVPPPTPSASPKSTQLLQPLAGASGASPAASSSAAPRVSFGVSTVCNVGKSSENQDSFVASANSSGSKCLVGVFDGHGEQGKRISEFAKTQIAKSLFSNKDLHANPASALEGAYFDAQRQIERHHSTEAHHSGTTAVAAYQHREKLVVANVGDSRAVLGRTNSRDGSDLKAIDVTSDQKPGRQDERRRILSAGGVVQQSQYPMRQTFGGPPRLMRVGPERVWDRTGCCGLGVTRSLGDLAMHPFVVANPELHERQIDSKDKLLILGSDGVWDRLRSQEAVDIAARHNDPTAAAREITDVARQRWHQETQGHVSDDITAVVVRLDSSGVGPSGVGSSGANVEDASPAEPASPVQLPKSRRSTAEADRDRVPDLFGGSGRLTSDAALRLGSRPRRRPNESVGGRNRKLPLHNWKGPKD